MYILRGIHAQRIAGDPPKFQDREGEEAKILRRAYAEAGVEVPAKFRVSLTTAE